MDDMRKVVNWSIFDMGGNIYQTIINTFVILPAIIIIMLESGVQPDRVYILSNLVLSNIVLVTNVILALFLPLYGTFVDNSSNKKFQLYLVTGLNLAGMLLFFPIIQASVLWLLLAVYLFCELAFRTTRVTYLAILSLIVEDQDKQGRAISIGVLLSYLGSFLGIVFSIVSRDNFGEFSIQATDYTIGYIPYLIIIGVVGYFITIIPLATLKFSEENHTQPQTLDLFSLLRRNYRDIRLFVTRTENRSFLIILFFINYYTIIMFLFSAQIINIGFEYDNPTIIISQFVVISIFSAILFAFGFGKLADTIDLKYSFLIVNFLFGITYISASIINIEPNWFFSKAMVFIMASLFGPALAGGKIAQRKYIFEISFTDDLSSNLGLLISSNRLFVAISPYLWTMLSLGIVQNVQDPSGVIRLALFISGMCAIIPFLLSFKIDPNLLSMDKSADRADFAFSKTH